MRLADLADQRVAIWGYGREGHAALRALRERLPHLPLTLFCAEHDTLSVDPLVQVQRAPPDAHALAAFDVVIKSPGISAYTPELLAAQAQGTIFTSGTALWFAEQPTARVIAVTGTKGKSTTVSLIAHLARSLGVRTALVGNIGLPLLDLCDQHADLWVIELSSFQTGEAGPLQLGVITSLYEEHLDWHGSRERYITDKLRLAEHARTLLVNATQANLLARTAAHPKRQLFGDPSGWHVADGWIKHASEPALALADLAVPGEHNALNVCAALTALDLVGLGARAALPSLPRFQPLPHRLQRLGQRDGRLWVNDSISTTPQATLAALRSLGNARVSVIVGGHDRGLDWSEFAAAMLAHAAHAIIAQGANGPRIAQVLREVGVTCALELVADLEAAVTCARAVTPAQ
ncbi:MAG: UDP-N-acetylmuramoyl-L-alanine--D-glutamate ligase, partial [Xanthomonadales bacterium]|nr:UDP-N-acetylmuramoyl-L-alanine--D-glutamate ligase [Xanthomonadales bacterium]